MFEWLLVKIILKFEKTNKTQQMISNDNFNTIYGKIDVIKSIRELYQFQSHEQKSESKLMH